MRMTLYFIGTPEGAQRNQYQAITADATEAKRLATELGMDVYAKEKDMRPPRRRKRANK